MSSRLFPYLLLGICLVAPFATGCSLRDGRSEGDILFVRERANADTAIYLMSEDGGDVRRLVAGNSPRWSPDGTRFAYSKRLVGRSLWVMNPDTGEKRRIVRAEAILAFAWAPDGVRLAYSDGYLIFVVNTETGDSEPVSIDLAQGRLDWSPDGRKLLVSSIASVKILDLRTGAEREIAPRVHVDGGMWSPDGERMAFVEQNYPYNPRRKAFDLPADGVAKGAIVTADRDGSSRERVTDGSAFDSEPAWSDDGERIYFTRQPPVKLFEEVFGESEIYVADLETRSLRRLTDSAVAERSPDPRPAYRSLPDPPEPETGDVVVPDLVDRNVLFEDEKRGFRALGLGLKAVLFPPLRDWLFVVREQVPPGGSRVTRGTVVKVDGSDLASVYAHFRTRFLAGRWRAHADCKADNPRARMYWDLVHRVLRRGMSRERVFSLLGRPGRSDGRTSAWPIGGLSLARVDCIYLRVEFDRRGRATRFYQSTS